VRSEILEKLLGRHLEWSKKRRDRCNREI